MCALPRTEQTENTFHPVAQLNKFRLLTLLKTEYTIKLELPNPAYAGTGEPIIWGASSGKT